MAVLPLLDDGSCSVQNTCLTNADAVHATCPQLFKCGTCVAWTPREKNRFTRNSGQCLLDRSSTQYLDCNAPICPYYRPRADSPAALEWRARPTTERSREVKKRTGTMTREAPPPSPEALAFAGFQHQPDAVGAVGVPALVGLLGPDPLAPLLERFRGGTVQVSGSDGTRELPIEALWARLLLVRRALERLEVATSSSRLESETRQKVEKDVAGMAGSMTTFNLLFARRDDGFKGTGKGE
jgi:hypothetical protein